MKTGILTGPTASGKTAIALAFARAQRSAGRTVEIINADSLLFYRGMDIGTAKPTKQEQQEIPHHLIDIRNPDEPFTAGDFARAAQTALEDVVSRGNKPLIVGGSGFYLKALLYGMWDAPPSSPELRATLEQQTNNELFCTLLEQDPEGAKKINPQDRYRLIRAIEILKLTGKTPSELRASQPKEPSPKFELWVVDRANEDLFSKVHVRTGLMLEQPWLDEVKNLQRAFPDARALKSVGYAQVQDFISNAKPQGRKIKPGIAGLRDEVELATRQLIKRQRTWLNGLKRNISSARWFLLDEEQNALFEAMRVFFEW